jgi:ABC-type spermidine/putrescine transport system permease subunit I
MAQNEGKGQSTKLPYRWVYMPFWAMFIIRLSSLFIILTQFLVDNDDKLMINWTEIEACCPLSHYRNSASII